MKTTNIFKTAMVMAILLPVLANAQVSFGTRHGLTLSTFSKAGDLYDNDHFTYSYTGGIFASVPLNNSLSVVPELNYLRKGRTDEKDIVGTGSVTTVNCHYLQLPVMARYSTSISESGNYKMYLNAGPYSALMLKSDRTITANSETPSAIDDKNGKTFDFGLVLGGGVLVPVSKYQMMLDLRYDMGLNKLDNQPDNYRTKGLSLSVGIQF
ncbi:MAG: PorT family protein [Bacteroidetes bacterium]|nr:PorT family protein [Bacteroidota bacterium]